MANDGTLKIETGSVAVTSMRYHELAVQAWLYTTFFVKAGYPVPVVFGTPMDAFSKFKDLWSRDNNPFNYLFDLKDDEGRPLYEPYPSVPRYPLISVLRKGWKYRSYQNSSIHQWRHLNWPTVSSDVQRADLGHVTTSYMPIAWDYRFQIDHFSMRPDTQALFIEKCMRTWWKTGGVPQNWIQVNYPGIGKQLVRIWLDGDLEWSTPEEPEADKIVEYKTTFNIVLEGYSMDLDYQYPPALWTLLIGQRPASVDELNQLTPLANVNLRIGDNNPTLLARKNIPAEGTASKPLLGQPIVQFISLGTGTPVSPDPIFIPSPLYSYGIASEEVFGVPTFALS